MILKSSQRANGADLAIHLMNALDNESIEVAQVWGTVADDLAGAFAEFEFIARGTKATKPLYSLSISPPKPITREQYFEAIRTIERRLGLAGQPHAIVFHVKDGREHCHVVWSRIDAGKMRAIHMSHDHAKLMDLACDLARKFGLELPKGLRDWEAKRRQAKDALEPSLAENAQEAVTGISPEQRRADITAAFEASDSAAAFANALEERGYVLTRGDRRGFVVVDEAGNVHSLSRYVKGHSAKAIRAKLAPLKPDDLPSVEEAKDLMRQRLRARQEREREGARDEEIQRKARERRQSAEAGLARKQQARRAKLSGEEQDLKIRNAAERMTLGAAQSIESETWLYKFRRAVSEFINRTPGLRSVLGPIQKMAGLDPADRHRLERDAIARRHSREQANIERKKRTLTRLENRERRSLLRRLAQAEARDRALAVEAERLARAEEVRRAEEARRKEFRTRPFEDGELTFTFNEESFGSDDGHNSGDGAGEDHDGPDTDGPDHENSPDTPGNWRSQRKGRGYRR